MAVKSKSANQIYFNKDHEMVHKAVREFVDKEINPLITKQVLRHRLADWLTEGDNFADLVKILISPYFIIVFSK